MNEDMQVALIQALESVAKSNRQIADALVSIETTLRVSLAESVKLRQALQTAEHPIDAVSFICIAREVQRAEPFKRPK